MKRAALALLLLAATAAHAQVRLPPGQADKIFPNRPLKNANVKIDASAVVPQHWDFENASLQGFTADGNAFTRQPTYGNNVSTKRAIDMSSAQPGTDPYLTQLVADLRKLGTDLNTIGGNYWDTPFPIGQQGMYWIGSAEERTRASQPFAGSQGDAATGSLVSPLLDLQQTYFSVLVGGGCSKDVGVYLQGQQPALRATTTTGPIGQPGQPLPQPQPQPGTGGPSFTQTMQWVTLKDKTGHPVEARGACIENMSRVTFDISNLKGQKARILIEDRATGAMGHINVDDIWLTNSAPAASSRVRDPVFGVADLHAHLMNEKTYAAYNESGTIAEAHAMWGSATGPLSNLKQCNDTHTTSDNNYTSFQDEVWGTTYTLCRDMCLNMLDGAGLTEHAGDQLSQDGVLGGYHDTHGGYPNFTAWPMWWSATHQQMHWEWVKRAYQGGLRLMVAAVGNSEVISFALAKEENRQFASDQDALALQIPAIKAFAAQNSTWAEVALTPRDARRIINSGKLAIVIGVELDHVFDSCSADVTHPHHHTAERDAEPNVWIGANHLDVSVSSAIVGVAEFITKASIHVMRVREAHPDHCTSDEIEARLDALYHAGVRQLLPMHFSDNLFGGYALTDPLFTAAAIFENGGAHPPQVMSQADIERNFGDRARRFVPVTREAYYGENAHREGEWRSNLPIRKKLDGLSLPIWLTLGAGSIMDGTLLPPGPGRAIMQFFAGQCIEDDGLRIAAAFFTGGASEAACGISTLTDESINAARSTMPYEGAIDSPAMIPIDAPNAWKDPTNGPVFHVNARGLQPEGQVLIQQMMRRGMMIDMQHSSEMTKRGILAQTQQYPVMVSHGGVQDGAGREQENVLSSAHLSAVYAPPNGITPGIVGVGTQSASGVMATVRQIAAGTPQQKAVALGTDLNGMDWHAPPRFGQFAFYPKSPDDRRLLQTTGAIGPMVRYDAYDPATNPYSRTRPTCNGEALCTTWQTAPAGDALHPLQVSDHGAVARTFDINYDGLAHYGMIPDFLQELSVIGTTREDMGVLFRSAEGTISMWEEGCWQAYGMSSRPTRLAEGCGPESLYH